MIEATNSDESSDLVFLATKSLIVQTAMTITNATIGFILEPPSERLLGN
jgi:hypothetical protein